ncbi:MAG: SUMF1/EgtB/PvdO family nonheme iron enzyme [Victivallaceae bacterium]|nr:SUMF1/EgtB/PvdO family nonheme iron enzyme [Victivallaceae bacterium]
MICRDCGKIAPDDAVFCPACGTKCKEECSMPQEDDPHGNDADLCAYCGQIVQGDAKVCPNCGMEQYCSICGTKLPDAANKCPGCNTKTPAFKKQIAWLERRNFSKWKWLILGSVALVIFILSVGYISTGHIGIDLGHADWYLRREKFDSLSESWRIACVLLAIPIAPLYLFFLRMLFIKKETDGKAIVSTPGYWKNRFPADLIERQNETEKPQRMGVFQAVGFRHWIIGGCLFAAVLVIFGIGNARISSARKIAAAHRIAEGKRYIANVMDFLIHCPAGSFMMGSPSYEDGCGSDEMRHRVTLTKDFYIGKYEVTQAQYEAVMGKNPSFFGGGDCPVERVSWDDAMNFCEKLNELTEGKRPAGYKFSLPTEAQWEYACRAGSTGAYAGNLDSMGWYVDNSGNETHNVGQKQPNAWGIYDMHGNVLEWCRDWYEGYTGSATDPTGPCSGLYRVGRGGGWINLARYCRSAYRYGDAPGGCHSYLGFRVALVPEQ